MATSARTNVEPPARLTPLERLIPGRWLRRYEWRNLSRDAIAAAAVAILLVPQAMAYALLADLPPSVGLYAAIAPAMAYALFGTSRYLAVGPTALVSLIVGESIGRVASETDAAPGEIALTLALLTGLILLVVGLARLGFMVQFVSQPVLTGFAAGAAVLIAFTQLRHLLGLDIPRSDGVVETTRAIVANLQGVMPVALSIGLTGLFLLVFGRRLLEKGGVSRHSAETIVRMMPLIVVVLAGLAVVFLRERTPALPLVGSTEMGLPPLTLPAAGWDLWVGLAPSALVIATLILVTAVAISRSLGSRKRESIDPDQELVALGAANLAASVTGGYPTGGSISRSAVAFEAGATSPMACGLSALIVAGAALVAGPLMAYLPKAILAAIIVSAVFGLIRPAEIREAWRYSRADGGSLLITAFAVIIFGVEVGIVIGVLAGLVVYLWRTSRPRIVVEGRVADTDHFRSDERDAVESTPDPVLVVRIDQDLYFANAARFEERVLHEVADHAGARCLLIDMKGVNMVDLTGLKMLEGLTEHLAEAGVEVSLADVRGPVRERLDRLGFVETIGEDRIFLSPDEGVELLCARLARSQEPGAGSREPGAGSQEPGTRG